MTHYTSPEIADRLASIAVYRDDYATVICDDVACIKSLGIRFDLVIADPPYGIEVTKMKLGATGDSKCSDRDGEHWDGTIPSQGTINALIDPEVAASTCIFGGNYMAHMLPPTGGWLVWDKDQIHRGAEVELIWSNLPTPARSFRLNRLCAFRYESKVHITQKPTDLAAWMILLTESLQPVDIICDAYSGSGTFVVEAKRLGLQCVAIEQSMKKCEQIAARLADTKVMRKTVSRANLARRESLTKTQTRHDHAC